MDANSIVLLRLDAKIESHKNIRNKDGGIINTIVGRGSVVE